MKQLAQETARCQAEARENSAMLAELKEQEVDSLAKYSGLCQEFVGQNY